MILSFRMVYKATISYLLRTFKIDIIYFNDNSYRSQGMGFGWNWVEDLFHLRLGFNSKHRIKIEAKHCEGLRILVTFMGWPCFRIEMVMTGPTLSQGSLI